MQRISLNAIGEDCVKAMIQLTDCTRHLIDAQLYNDGTFNRKADMFSKRQ